MIAVSPTQMWFTAHERIVGHGWEEGYTVTGVYDGAKGLVTVTKLDRISATGRPPMTW